MDTSYNTNIIDDAIGNGTTPDLFIYQNGCQSQYSDTEA